MRKLVVSEFVTLDGVMEAPENWSVFEYWTKEIGQFKDEELFAGGVLLLGRVTYEIFAGAWPTLTDEENWRLVKEAGGEPGEKAEGNPFSDRMNSIPKYVVSRTLKEATWNNSTLIRENIPEQVSRLKKQTGKDILIYGSAELANSLFQHGLVDEFRLLVFPVIIGKGKRLFKEGGRKAMRLEEVKLYTSGVLLLRYRPEREIG
jgi:dihydrofolate reductase